MPRRSIVSGRRSIRRDRRRATDVEDHQYFEAIAGMLKARALTNTIGMLGAPDEYATVLAQPPSPSGSDAKRSAQLCLHRRGGRGGGGEHGQEILYGSLYWRAGEAINKLARVHFLTPAFDASRW